MKKRGVSSVIMTICIVLCLFFIGKRIFIDGECIGELKDNINSTDSVIVGDVVNTLCDFNGDKDYTIRIKYNTQVKKGKLTLKLVDSKGNVEKEFPIKNENVSTYTLKKDDKYEILANYDEFEGKIDIKCYKK